MEDQAIAVVEASTQYVGRWNRLISTTNWEKGRIICQWREALRQAGAPAASCTDDAWSRQVGNVTPQHVGRLRRVFERFGEVFDQYAGLYWSHFQAAVDWPDAEMYLEGAVQKRVVGFADAQPTLGSHRRPARSETARRRHRRSELDEDVSADDDSPLPAVISDSPGEVHATHERNADDEDDDAFDDGHVRRSVRLLGSRGLGGRPAGRAAAASVRVAAALAARLERGDGLIPPGDSQPQGIRLAGDFPQRRVVGARIAQAVGPGPGGVAGRASSGSSEHTKANNPAAACSAC